MKNLFISLRLLAVMTLLTGLLYPALLTVTAGWMFPFQARGSVVTVGEKPVGSLLLAQKSDPVRDFQPRPSAADYATLPSGASNLGPTSAALAQAVAARRAEGGERLPVGLLTASGSGLDPHLSPEAVLFQVPRVAAARSRSLAEVEAVVKKMTEPAQFGFLGEPRVNILALNLALDESQHP